MGHFNAWSVVSIFSSSDLVLTILEMKKSFKICASATGLSCLGRDEDLPRPKSLSTI